MKILFCGGGTAGHVMPAIAMAQIIEKNFKNVDIAFVGRCGGNENRSIIKCGYSLYTIDVMGLERKLSIKSIKAIYKALSSSRTAKRIMCEFNPDIVIGTGGYVCYPIIRMAQKMHIPNMMHESNVYPGIVTRHLGSKCTMLLLNMEGTKKYLKRTDNAVTVGNPLRADFKDVNRSDARQLLKLKENDILILSFGGSLGSEVMNDIIIKLMSQYSVSSANIAHIHATGINNFKRLKELYPELASGKGKCKIVPYIDDMPIYLRAADIVISRSGAMTISELATAGVASILIPSPNVAENHQYVNAKHISDRNAAILIEESKLSAEHLKNTVKSLVENSVVRKSLAVEIAKTADKNVDQNIINVMRKIL